MAVYTVEEIEQHNKEEDCWIIVRGKVYDVTKYLDDHPGGVEIITELAGKDSTEDYDDVGHSEEAHEILEKYYIGDVGSVSSSSSAPAPAKVEAAPKAVVEKSVVQKQASKPPKQASDDNSTMLLMAGAVAVAGVAFFLLRRKSAK